MNALTSILVIALGVASLAVAPSLTSNHLANATGARTGWCNQQPKDEGWVSGCVDGWYDHDHCKKYDPSGTSQEHPNWPYSKGYKVGWDRGHCK